MAANPSAFDFAAQSSLQSFLPPEPYVSAERVAEHLAIERRQVLNLTRSARIPAYPIDPSATRKQYRYKLSEVDAAISSASQKIVAPSVIPGNNGIRQPRDWRGKLNG